MAKARRMPPRRRLRRHCPTSIGPPMRPNQPPTTERPRVCRTVGDLRSRALGASFQLSAEDRRLSSQPKEAPMSKVVIDMSMSLDGFVAGPDDGKAHPLG